MHQRRRSAYRRRPRGVCASLLAWAMGTHRLGLRNPLPGWVPGAAYSMHLRDTAWKLGWRGTAVVALVTQLSTVACVLVLTALFSVTSATTVDTGEMVPAVHMSAPNGATLVSDAVTGAAVALKEGLAKGATPLPGQVLWTSPDPPPAPQWSPAGVQLPWRWPDPRARAEQQVSKAHKKCISAAQAAQRYAPLSHWQQRVADAYASCMHARGYAPEWHTVAVNITNTAVVVDGGAHKRSEERLECNWNPNLIAPSSGVLISNVCAQGPLGEGARSAGFCAVCPPESAGGKLGPGCVDVSMPGECVVVRAVNKGACEKAGKALRMDAVVRPDAEQQTMTGDTLPPVQWDERAKRCVLTHATTRESCLNAWCGAAHQRATQTGGPRGGNPGIPGQREDPAQLCAPYCVDRGDLGVSAPRRPGHCKHGGGQWDATAKRCRVGLSACVSARVAPHSASGNRYWHFPGLLWVPGRASAPHLCTPGHVWPHPPKHALLRPDSRGPGQGMSAPVPYGRGICITGPSGQRPCGHCAGHHSAHLVDQDRADGREPSEGGVMSLYSPVASEWDKRAADERRHDMLPDQGLCWRMLPEGEDDCQEGATLRHDGTCHAHAVHSQEACAAREGEGWQWRPGCNSDACEAVNNESMPVSVRCEWVGVRMCTDKQACTAAQGTWLPGPGWHPNAQEAWIGWVEERTMVSRNFSVGQAEERAALSAAARRWAMAQPVGQLARTRDVAERQQLVPPGAMLGPGPVMWQPPVHVPAAELHSNADVKVEVVSAGEQFVFVPLGPATSVPSVAKRVWLPVWPGLPLSAAEVVPGGKEAAWAVCSPAGAGCRAVPAAQMVMAWPKQAALQLDAAQAAGSLLVPALRVDISHMQEGRNEDTAVSVAHKARAQLCEFWPCYGAGSVCTVKPFERVPVCVCEAGRTGMHCERAPCHGDPWQPGLVTGFRLGEFEPCTCVFPWSGAGCGECATPSTWPADRFVCAHKEGHPNRVMVRVSEHDEPLWLSGAKGFGDGTDRPAAVRPGEDEWDCACRKRPPLNAHSRRAFPTFNETQVDAFETCLNATGLFAADEVEALSDLAQGGCAVSDCSPSGAPLLLSIVSAVMLALVLVLLLYTMSSEGKQKKQEDGDGAGIGSRIVTPFITRSPVRVTVSKRHRRADAAAAAATRRRLSRRSRI